ncbi:MAG: LLM class flavin-dependent oxidoreductase [Candidatus Lustribacter sp.]|jgi:alkanesulfonate monooxygenase SsuD/methylene tetrahydromethanopterin reductase-like flavin-dependent oxidoreductase (luciferase family)
MEFGIQFFPAVGPAQVSAEQYFADAIELAARADELGYEHVRTIEHYFHPYGGYSPNPLLFLTAVAARTQRVRLVTGAVLPAFNHPLKLAGEIGMLDAISHGRVEVGFARAFLPHEFQRFGVSLDDSRARFDEGLEAVRLLLEDEDVAFDGRFHAFPPTTSLPRPTQHPRPPFWVAAIGTEASFVNAGRLGHGIMAIPLGGPNMQRLIGAYRDAWKAAGHPGEGRVMIAFHMFCHETPGEAARIAREPLEHYIRTLVDAATDWIDGTSSNDYPGYDKLIAKIKSDTFESNVAQGAAWIGTPDEIVAQIHAFNERSGPFESASLQVNFCGLPFEPASRSMKLFAEAVIPQFRPALAGV